MFGTLKVDCPRLVEVAVVTEHLALGDLNLLTCERPGPNSMSYLGRSVDVVEFKALSASAPHALFVSEEGGSTSSHPLSLIFPLCFRRYHRHSASVAQLVEPGVSKPRPVIFQTPIYQHSLSLQAVSLRAVFPAVRRWHSHPSTTCSLSSGARDWASWS